MVADIVPGSGSADILGLRVANDILFFNADDDTHGMELWVTDGSAAGTRMLADINPGPGSSLPASKTVLGNLLLFSADDGTGRALWVSDGTTAGTRKVKAVNPGFTASSLTPLATLNERVYFFASDALWVTDGTEAGTVKVADVRGRRPGVAGARLFFEGWTAATGWELWVSDGTTGGTRPVTEIAPGTKDAFSTNLTNFGFAPFGDRVLFIATDGVHGRELWISDGMAAGTRMIRDLVPGSAGMYDAGATFVLAFNGRAYFTGYDDAHGWELWSTDGTSDGTALFADITPGPEWSVAQPLLVLNGKLFFIHRSNGIGGYLGSTDGTAAGTRLLDAPLGQGFRAIGDRIYFTGDTAGAGREPWITDGTAAGTRMIANLAPDAVPSSDPRALTPGSTLLYFFARDGFLDAESNSAEHSLWRSDGTAAGTFKPREPGQHSPAITAVGNLLLFREGTQWMLSDGTVAGTKPADAFLRRFGLEPQVGALFPFGETLFATVNGKLWKTTAAPNAPAVQLGAPGASGMIESSGQYVFYSGAHDTQHDVSLWTTD
ncbi:MAG: ELWxxDGT repeat protein, partial [Thermoanaerobaculia bacterium]